MKIKVFKKNFFTIKKLNLIFCFLIAGGMLFYLAGVNDLTVKGFVLKDLREKASKLDKKIYSKEVRATDLESYGRLSKRAEELKMVKFDKMEHISPQKDVAKR